MPREGYSMEYSFSNFYKTLVNRRHGAGLRKKEENSAKILSSLKNKNGGFLLLCSTSGFFPSKRSSFLVSDETHFTFHRAPVVKTMGEATQVAVHIFWNLQFHNRTWCYRPHQIHKEPALLRDIFDSWTWWARVCKNQLFIISTCNLKEQSIVTSLRFSNHLLYPCPFSAWNRSASSRFHFISYLIIKSTCFLQSKCCWSFILDHCQYILQGD